MLQKHGIILALSEKKIKKMHNNCKNFLSLHRKNKKNVIDDATLFIRVHIPRFSALCKID